MGDSFNEKPTMGADERILIHDICDAYERDRQSNTTVSMQSYIEQAPEAAKHWVLKELLAIELEILETSGETPARELLFKSAGVSAASFDAAWQLLQHEGAVSDPDRGATVSRNQDDTRIREREKSSRTTALYQGRTFAADFAHSTIGAAGEQTTGSLKATGLIADDFELLDMLGEGGMGIVYRAYQHSLQREVALKIIPQRFMNSTQVVARFYIEAEAAASMDHPGIVPVYEFGECNRIHYYAMALVEGGNLSQFVGSNRKMPTQRMEIRPIVEIMKKVALAVQYAHDHAVIHRDIKPANILIDPQGQPRLADFGLAKNLDKNEESLTLTGNVLGTPAYMAPEQASGEKGVISNRTDVYALGATIYALLAARPPFEGGGQYEIVKKVQESNPPALKEIAPETPLDLQTICEKCLAKRPQERYPSASELADELQRYLGGYPISARPIGPLQKMVSWCRRNPVVASLIGGVWAALLVGAMVSTFFWLQAEDSARKANESAEKRKDYLSNTYKVVDDKLSGDDLISQSARQALLKHQKSFYDDLVVELLQQHDAKLRLEYADTLFKLGKVQAAFSEDLSDDSDARHAYETALAVHQELLTENNSDAELLKKLLASFASTHHELGKLGKKKWEWERNRSQATPEEDKEEAQRGMEEWIRHSLAALELRKQVVTVSPEDAESHRLLASSQESSGIAHVVRGLSTLNDSDIEKGREYLRIAQEGRTKALAQFSNSLDLLFDLAKGHGNIAVVSMDYAFSALNQQDIGKQQALLHSSTEAALDAINTYKSAEPELLKDLNARSDLANCHEIRGRALSSLGQYDQATGCYENAIQEMQWVCRRNPLVYHYRQILSFYQSELAIIYFRNAQNQQGDQALHDFRSTLVEALRAAPENRDAASLFTDTTFKIVEGWAPTEENLPIRQSILNGAIRDLQSLMHESNEYLWLAPQVDNLKNALQRIEAEAPVS